MRQLFLLSSLICAVACTTDPSAETEGSTTTETTTPAGQQPATYSTAERDSWQKPQEVFLLMGNELRGKTIADLAADDGYFTFKMIEVGANVIAIDSDPAKLEKIEARKKELKLGDDRLQTRLGSLNDPNLSPEEVDACLLVHSFVRIPDKKTFFTKVFQGTREPKPLFIVEWLNSATPIGPPMTDRVSAERVMDEVSVGGYTDIGTYTAKIPYQAFIFASRQPEMDFPDAPDDEPVTDEEIMNVPMH